MRSLKNDIRQMVLKDFNISLDRLMLALEKEYGKVSRVTVSGV